MVGVAGKYKGCNTCRLRRVKCDQMRPICKKCVDTGRDCAGYQRERVFIIGTPDDQGRCSSHPRRTVSGKGSPTPTSKKGRSTPLRSVTPDKLDLVPVHPLRTAWDDLIPLSSRGTVYHVQLAALHTSLPGVVRRGESGSSTKFTIAEFPPYVTPDARPLSRGEKDFTLQSQCMVHLSPSSESVDPDTGLIKTDSICMFLYERNASCFLNSQSPMTINRSQQDAVLQRRPEGFRHFPAHHFFARVYRPNAIGAALLSRQSIFLSTQEWATIPWEAHPKSMFDRLLDIIALLPSIFSRADQIMLQHPTLARRLTAQDLLTNCVSVERALDAWCAAVFPDTGAGADELHGYQQYQFDDLSTGLGAVPPPFYVQDNSGSSPGGPGMETQIPFTQTFGFADGVTALMFVYYWTALILLYPTVEKIQDAIFQPAVDAYPQLFPNLPPSLAAINPLKYGAKEVRELAANVCRSLDFALAATVQPDLLVVPLFAVEEFYRELNASTGDGALEMLWCEAFKARLAAKGQDIADVVQDKGWVELRKF